MEREILQLCSGEWYYSLGVAVSIEALGRNPLLILTVTWDEILFKYNGGTNSTSLPTLT